jgi:hypothetical protein
MISKKTINKVHKSIEMLGVRMTLATMARFDLARRSRQMVMTFSYVIESRVSLCQVVAILASFIIYEMELCVWFSVESPSESE